MKQAPTSIRACLKEGYAIADAAVSAGHYAALCRDTRRRSATMAVCLHLQVLGGRLQRRFVTLLLPMLTMVLVMAGPSAAQETALTVENAYVRGLPPGQKNTAAFFKLMNHSDRDIQIRAGRSAAATALEIHAHERRDGMMAMRMQDSVTVPAGQSLDFAPGGLHLMLLGLHRPLVDGDETSFSLMLRQDGVDQSQSLEITAPVISVLKMNQKQSHKHGEH